MDINCLRPDQFLVALNVAYPGLHLIRPDGLAAALDAPCMAFEYGGQTDLAILSALYAERVAKAHAFADGNKRAATFACLLFLSMNNATPDVPKVAMADGIENLAKGTQTAEDFAAMLDKYMNYSSCET